MPSPSHSLNWFIPILQMKPLCSRRAIPLLKKCMIQWSGLVMSVSRQSYSAEGMRIIGLTISSMRKTSLPLKSGSYDSLMPGPQGIWQVWTLKDDSGGATGVRWPPSLMSTSVNKVHWTWRGGNVMFLGLSICLPYTDLFRLPCFISRFWSTHNGVTLIIVLSYHWSPLSL